jgi:hypothetical protein
LKEEALDRIKWSNRFGRGFGPLVWQISDDDDNTRCSRSKTRNSTDLASSTNMQVSNSQLNSHNNY